MLGGSLSLREKLDTSLKRVHARRSRATANIRVKELCTERTLTRISFVFACLPHPYSLQRLQPSVPDGDGRDVLEPAASLDEAQQLW